MGQIKQPSQGTAAAGKPAEDVLRKDQGGCRGFTLLEVLISVSVISIVFVSLFRLQSGTADLVSADQFNSTAPLLARQLVGRIEQDLEGWSESEGDFSPEFPGMSWTCEISDVALESTQEFWGSEPVGLKKIDISILAQGKERRFDISTWRVSSE